MPRVSLQGVAGHKFHRLTLLNEAAERRNGRVVWDCQCDCGNKIIARLAQLKSGNTKSCGCLNKELTVQRNIATALHGMTDSRTFVSWDSMKQRCLNTNHKSYGDYGGRGITVCERWLESFNNFLADMGERPEGKSLDRIDNDKGYEPTNCRWATHVEQGNNRRSSRLLTHAGKTQTAIQWAREYGLGPKTLLYRLKAGWSLKESLTMETNYANKWEREAIKLSV